MKDLFDFSFHADGSSVVMKCPQCKFEYGHEQMIEAFFAYSEGRESGGWYVPVVCENHHLWFLRIYSHKGMFSLEALTFQEFAKRKIE